MGGHTLNTVILLVEDNTSDEKLTVLAFKQCGIANVIDVVRDGAAALDFLFATGEHAGRDASILPSVVLLDLNLPKIGGLEVLRRIRADERTKLLPVVVLTASKEEEDIVKSYSLGANAYVRKPVAFAEFAEAVKTLGLFWLLLNQRPPKRPGAA
jgi:two-component system, response regulator